MEQEQKIGLLIKKRMAEIGSVALAAAIGVSPGYLYDIIRGSRPPSDKILEYLGYRWTIVRLTKKREI